MKRSLNIFFISMLIVLTIAAGKLFIKVNTELETQLKVSEAVIEENTASVDTYSEQENVIDSNIDKEENGLYAESGQVFKDETERTDERTSDHFEAYEEPQRRKDKWNGNVAKIKEIQEKIALDILKQDYEMDNRGRIDRRQQPKTRVAGISTLANLTVELLDWWEEADKLFEKDVPVVVTDVETGKSFLATRTYGSSHADAETLTIEDTAIMLEIWGGEWNWERRAVTIEVNGRKLAASASGMPHAGLDSLPEGEQVDNRSGDFGTGTNLDKIKGNNMDGHFDIHFLNSRTHGTDKVDEMHQKKVQEAFR